MDLPLRGALLPKLQEAFPGAAMRIGLGAEPLVTFLAKHPAVGDLEIHDEGDELTVFIGSITHRHFCSQDPAASAQAQADQLASEVTEYLQQLFADRIEFFGNGFRGGARVRSDRRRSVISRLLLGRRSFVWSGPLGN
jgi:hypothetical protein